MLTFVTVPKACDGVFGHIQYNAVRSWLNLRPRPGVILVGGESGVSEMADELNVRHVPNVARNENNTPLLRDVFAQALRVTNQRIICYINADVMLDEDFISSVRVVRRAKELFLMVGQCHDIDVRDEIDFSDDEAVSRLFSRAVEDGKARGVSAIDYFVFPRTLYKDVPLLAVGRVYFDNWMIWAARYAGAAVVDITGSALSIHQSHDYSHVVGGKQATRRGDEAHRNMQLAGGRRHCFDMLDATHRLVNGELHSNYCRHFDIPRRVGRFRDQANYAFWAAMNRTRSVRHAIGLRKAA